MSNYDPTRNGAFCWKLKAWLPFFSLEIPTLHFFLISQAPLFADKNGSRTRLDVKELTSQAYSARNFYSNVTAADGKYLAVSLVFRGPMTTQEVDENIEKLQR